MAVGRDILGSLLFGLGSGLSQYGKLKGEQAQLTIEEKKKQRMDEEKQKQKLLLEQQQNEADAQRQLDVLSSVDPKLAERLKMTQWRSKLGGVPIKPFEKDELGMFEQKMQQEQAQTLLDQMGGQDTVNEIATRTDEKPDMFNPLLKEDISQQQRSGPWDQRRAIEKVVETVRARQADAAIQKGRLKAQSGEGKEDAGATFTQQELWDRYQTFLRGRQTDYEQAQRAYDQELARFNTAQARMAKDPSYTNPYKEPNPPLRPGELESYDQDPQTSFLAWGQKQSNMLGEVGGKVRGVNQSSPDERPAKKSDPIDDWAKKNISDWSTLDEATKNKIRAKRRKELGN